MKSIKNQTPSRVLLVAIGLVIVGLMTPNNSPRDSFPNHYEPIAHSGERAKYTYARDKDLTSPLALSGERAVRTRHGGGTPFSAPGRPSSGVGVVVRA